MNPRARRRRFDRNVAAPIVLCGTCNRVLDEEADECGVCERLRERDKRIKAAVPEAHDVEAE